MWLLLFLSCVFFFPSSLPLLFFIASALNSSFSSRPSRKVPMSHHPPISHPFIPLSPLFLLFLPFFTELIRLQNSYLMSSFPPLLPHIPHKFIIHHSSTSIISSPLVHHPSPLKTPSFSTSDLENLRAR